MQGGAGRRKGSLSDLYVTAGAVVRSVSHCAVRASSSLAVTAAGASCAAFACSRGTPRSFGGPCRAVTTYRAGNNDLGTPDDALMRMMVASPLRLRWFFADEQRGGPRHLNAAPRRTDLLWRSRHCDLHVVGVAPASACVRALHLALGTSQVRGPGVKAAALPTGLRAPGKHEGLFAKSRGGRRRYGRRLR